LFADFQRDDEFDEYGDLVAEAPFVYEACPDLDTIRNRVIKKLDEYNGTPSINKGKTMNLVIFDDALRHLLRIARVCNSPSGSIMLVGVGGSGKQSLTRLSAYITKQLCRQI